MKKLLLLSVLFSFSFIFSFAFAGATITTNKSTYEQNEQITISFFLEPEDFGPIDVFILNSEKIKVFEHRLFLDRDDGRYSVNTSASLPGGTYTAVVETNNQRAEWNKLVIIESNIALNLDSTNFSITNKHDYNRNEQLTIKGITDTKRPTVAFIDPNNDIILEEEFNVGIGGAEPGILRDFSKSFSLGSNVFVKDGLYTIEIHHYSGDVDAETFTIVKGWVDTVVSLSIEEPIYSQGETLIVSGTVKNPTDEPIIIEILDPSENTILSNELDFGSDGLYSKSYELEPNIFTSFGTYWIKLSFYPVETYLTQSFLLDKSETNSDSALLLQLKEKIDELTSTVISLEQQIKELTQENEKLKKATESQNVPRKPVLDFVDSQKNPQNYVDRYENEVGYKEWFDESFPDYTIHEAVGLREPIPGWVKNMFVWFGEGQIAEGELVSGLEFLVKQRIIQVAP